MNEVEVGALPANFHQQVDDRTTDVGLTEARTGHKQDGRAPVPHDRGEVVLVKRAGHRTGAELGDPEVPAVVKPLSRIVRGVMVYRFEITVAIIVCLTRGASVRLAWLLLLPLTALSVLSSLGLGLWLGRGIMRVPDVKNTLPHFMRLAFYSSGVIFPVEIYIRETENGEFLLDLYTLLNPFFAMVKLHQGAILGYDQYPVQMAVMATVLWSFLFVMLGIRSIIRAEAEHQE